MDRRSLIKATLLTLLPVGWGPLALAQSADGAAASAIDYAEIVKRARRRAAKAHEPGQMTLASPFADLTYDKYRSIRMRREADPFADASHGFGMDLLAPGSVYRDRVNISLVDAQGTRELGFTPQIFSFDAPGFDLADGRSPEGDYSGLDYTGFRLRQAINRPDVLDEFLVFQGASYFRAVGRGMRYGLSARGLAIRTADPRGEEYPVFSNIWIMTPAPEAREILVYALLESPSCTGAYEFEITPGDTTVMRIRCTLFPRVDIAQIGIAPLTSMYYFGPSGPPGVNDFRNAVHDSQGLQMIRGDGQRLWRPLVNPRLVQTSAFVDENPAGFGLMQRPREFRAYQDDEARYELRPSAWVEPLNAWGKGTIILVEIPVENEFNDNIVCFWRPTDSLRPRDEGHEFAYRLLWGAQAPDTAPLARVIATRMGNSIHDSSRRVMVVDYRLEATQRDALTPNVWLSGGELRGVALRPLPERDLLRLSFEFSPGDLEIIEMQAYLEGSDGRASETWLFRWSPR